MNFFFPNTVYFRQIIIALGICFVNLSYFIYLATASYIVFFFILKEKLLKSFINFYKNSYIYSVTGFCLKCFKFLSNSLKFPKFSELTAWSFQNFQS